MKTAFLEFGVKHSFSHAKVWANSCSWFFVTFMTANHLHKWYRTLGWGVPSVMGLSKGILSVLMRGNPRFEKIEMRSTIKVEHSSYRLQSLRAESVCHWWSFRIIVKDCHGIIHVNAKQTLYWNFIKKNFSCEIKIWNALSLNIFPPSCIM